MYDALNPHRTTLPPLRTVRLILSACLSDEDIAEEWVNAWRAISLREFTSANPQPIGRPPSDTVVVQEQVGGAG
jgi:hypothetical protein